MRLVPSKNLQVIRSGEDVFIYNSLFGNLFRTTQKTLDLIDFFRNGDREDVEGRFGSEVTKEIEELRERLFLVEDGLDECELLRGKIEDVERKIKTGDILYKLQLIVTTECNLACVYCYRSNVVEPLIQERPTRMSFQTAKKAIDGFLNITQRNGKEDVYIRFFGGEPLLNWNLIKDIVLYIDNLDVKKPRINHILNTNGIILNDSIAKFLGEHDFRVSLSLDGVKEINDKLRKRPSGKGTFKRIDKVIDVLKQYVNDIEISTTLVDENLYHLRELIDYLHDKGLNEIDINTLCYSSQLDLLKAPTKEKVEQLADARSYGKEKGVSVGGKWFRLYKRTDEPSLSYCKRMGEQLSVEPSGDIYPCSGWPIKLGSVEDIDAILNSDEYREVAMRLVGNLPSCYGCEIEGMCAGGCAGNVHILTGDSYNPESNECEFRRAITKRLIPMEILEITKGECNQI
ncbi:MAG: radical SAM protein [Elusimicrobiota bacterium]|nr:radical SAM protein [Elusimicrobiota bacterium]